MRRHCRGLGVNSLAPGESDYFLWLLLGKEFFPNLISAPFMTGLHVAFYLSAAMCLLAAVVSLLRGERYVNADAAQRDEPVSFGE
jgi:hypothetical protein